MGSSNTTIFDIIPTKMLDVMDKEPDITNNNTWTLEIFAYLLLGGIIGGTGFCISVLCIICCIVKKRVIRRKEMENERNESSLSYDSYRSDKMNDDMFDSSMTTSYKKRTTLGSLVISELKCTLNAVAGYDNNDDIMTSSSIDFGI